jgi:hypothetical protein
MLRVIALLVSLSHIIVNSAHNQRAPITNYAGTLRVCAEGGFGNRIRVVLSYLNLARHTRRDLVVFWEQNHATNGHFSDIFDSTRMPTDLHVIEKLPPPGIKVLFSSSAYKSQAVQRMGHLALEVLHLRPELEARVDDLLAQLGHATYSGLASATANSSDLTLNQTIVASSGSFSAVHLRRTDLNSDYAQVRILYL